MNTTDIKYFHLSPDDKFLDYVISNCENIAADESVYIVRDSKYPLKYVKDKRVKVCLTLNDLSTELKKYDNIIKVYIHFLTNTAIPFTLSIPKHIKVYWIFWGADGYSLPGMEKFLFKEETKKFLIEAGINKRESFIRQLKNKISHKFGRGYKAKLARAVKRADVCATWIKGDYSLVKKYNPQMEYLFYNNNSVNQLIADDDLVPGYNNILEKLKDRRYIIVGNSGDPTNNHLEAFDIVKSMQDYDVVVPLSYGNRHYINRLAEEGIKVLGNRFVPIYNFMEKCEYNFLIKNAQFVIMNHTRQQAANNILTALWYGVPVYMDSSSTLYQTFKYWGVGVGEIHKLPHSFINPSVEENRKYLQQNIGNDTIKEAFRTLLKG